MQAQSLIEVFTEKDMELLHRAESPLRALERLLSIIKRLPGPRAYLGEPMGATDEQWWSEGRDVLSSVLAQQGFSIIDPDTLWLIVIWSEHLKPKNQARNPLLERLMIHGCIRHVFLADEKVMIKNRIENIYRTAANQGVYLHTWYPTVS